jgi:hypothetical protein
LIEVTAFAILHRHGSNFIDNAEPNVGKDSWVEGLRHDVVVAATSTLTPIRLIELIDAEF